MLHVYGRKGREGRTQSGYLFFGTRSIAGRGTVSREKRIRTKGTLLTRPYLRAYANGEQFATGICIDSGGDLYGIMSRHNLKTLCQLCTAFSSSHVSASSILPLLPFFLFLFLFLSLSLSRPSRLCKLFLFATMRCDIRSSQITLENISRADSCSNKNVSVIIHFVRGMRVTCLVVCIDRARHHTNTEYLLTYRIEISISRIYLYVYVGSIHERAKSEFEKRSPDIEQIIGGWVYL